MRSALLPILIGLVIAAGCSGSTPCPCPATQVGPGWCPAAEFIGGGPGCVCQTTTLCPGWCLPNGETTGQPFECGDSGTGTVDAGVLEGSADGTSGAASDAPAD